jgi:hypothetical protein
MPDEKIEVTRVDLFRQQTELVDRLLSAVERAEADIGGEGSLTVLGLLGPVNDQARASLALNSPQPNAKLDVGVEAIGNIIFEELEIDGHAAEIAAIEKAAARIAALSTPKTDVAAVLVPKDG